MDVNYEKKISLDWRDQNYDNAGPGRRRRASGGKISARAGGESKKPPVCSEAEVCHRAEESKLRQLGVILVIGFTLSVVLI